MKFIRLLLIFTITASAALAQQTAVWVQYSLADGSQTGTNSRRVSDSDLAALGKGQVEYFGDPSGMAVDITQHPPVVVEAPQDVAPETLAQATPCS